MVVAPRAQRRGSRRAAPTAAPEGSAGAPGLAERILAFEAYIGFQHDSIGLLAGLIVALRLLGRRNARHARA